jgi:hypothetical protein
VKPETDQRLSDHISIGVLTRVFPPELVDRIVTESGRTEQRRRFLPARVVLYYVLGLALFIDSSYEEVMRMLVEGLSWAGGWAKSWNVPNKAALFKARMRLGAQPLRELFAETATPLTTKRTKGAWFKGRRLMSIDGTCLDIAGTEANAAAFGRPGSAREDRVAAFPQIRVVRLAECATHEIVDAVVGKYSDAEQRLAATLMDELAPDMLLRADRGFFSFSLWEKAKATGADLLWRAKSNHVLDVHRRLSDGSYLSTIYPSTKDRRHDTNGARVRVIEYSRGDSDDATYRMLSTMLDPKTASAMELASLYKERWEFETALDELKSHQPAPAWCCAPRCPTACSRRFTPAAVCITPFDGSCIRSLSPLTRTPTGSASPAPSGWRAAPRRPTLVSPLRRLTPPTVKRHRSCSSNYSRPDVIVRTRASSNERCQATE